MHNQNTCNCPHHKVMPILIIVLGLALLANALAYITSGTLYIVIAVLVIIMGIKRMVRCNCCNGTSEGKM